MKCSLCGNNKKSMFLMGKEVYFCDCPKAQELFDKAREDKLKSIYQEMDISFKNDHEFKLPLKFQDADWKYKNIKPHINLLKDWFEKPTNLILSGDVGKGKSMLMGLIAKKLVERENLTNLNIYFVSFVDMLDDIVKGKYGDNDYDNRYHDCRYLCIDDFGKGKLTESREQELYHLLEYRNINKLVTIFTVNRVEKVVEKFSDKDQAMAVVRRMYDKALNLTIKDS